MNHLGICFCSVAKTPAGDACIYSVCCCVRQLLSNVAVGRCKTAIVFVRLRDLSALSFV